MSRYCRAGPPSLHRLCCRETSRQNPSRNSRPIQPCRRPCPGTETRPCTIAQRHAPHRWTACSAGRRPIRRGKHRRWPRSRVPRRFWRPEDARLRPSRFHRNKQPCRRPQPVTKSRRRFFSATMLSTQSAASRSRENPGLGNRCVAGQAIAASRPHEQPRRRTKASPLSRPMPRASP